MPRFPAISCSLFLALGFSGCERAGVPADPTSQALPAVPDRIEDIAGKSIHYRCGGGFEVVVAGDTARVALPDGRGVSLSRSASPEAMEFAGEALAFSVAGEAAALTQDEGGRFACTGVD